MDEDTPHGGPSKTAKRKRTLRLFHCRRPESVLSIAYIATLARTTLFSNCRFEDVNAADCDDDAYRCTYAWYFGWHKMSGVLKLDGAARCALETTIPMRDATGISNVTEETCFLSLSVYPNDIDRCSEPWRNALAYQQSQHRHHLCTFNGRAILPERDNRLYSVFFFVLHSRDHVTSLTGKWHSWCCPGLTHRRLPKQNMKKS